MMDFSLQFRRSQNTGDDIHHWRIDDDLGSNISSSPISNEDLTGMDVSDYSDPEFEYNDLDMSSSSSISDMRIDEDEDYREFIYQLCECTCLNPNEIKL
jgi:hypothetical protein